MSAPDVLNKIGKKYSNYNSDEELQRDDRLRMKERNEKYSEILSLYTSDVKKVLWTKFIFRIIFLVVSLAALIGTFAVFCVVLWWLIHKNVNVGYLETIVSVLSSMVSMVTVFIVLPKIMTKYLFDTEEEKNIYNVVKQIQDYDQVIRSNLK